MNTTNCPNTMTRFLSGLLLVTGTVVVLSGSSAPAAQPPGFPPVKPPASQPTTRPSVPSFPELPSLPTTSEEILVQGIQRAHGAKAWSAKPALRADIHVEFGGNEFLSGTLTFDTASGLSRLELQDETVLVFDGERAWVSPATSEFTGARFHLLTWPYFLAAPFKLADPGTHLESTEFRRLGLRLYESAKLTFDAGVGDTPDDWYLLFVDSASKRLAGMAYIVTYGTAPEDAERDPHVVVFDGYHTLGGVTLSTAWAFHDWDPESPTLGDPIGRVRLSNLEFIVPEEGLFKRPSNAREDTLPDS